MLSQGTGYAATALAFVAAAGGRPVLVREVADAADIPAPYLSKIIHALSKRGLVNTQRGIGGGVTLARPAGEITLMDLCEALADPVLQARCLLGTAECSDDRACPAHRFWKAQRGRMLEYLQTMTVADVAAFETRRQWKATARSAGNGNGDGSSTTNGHELS
ncbi:MAG: Rrf2 family transcriptional regulator [Phycisphaerales bacterium]|nr:Rrf2 family transcriptional regulator [Phycisphaerales bacterium]